MKTQLVVFWWLLLTGLAPRVSVAQDLQIGAAQRTIAGQTVPGWASALPLDRRRVEKAWADRLRRWGKVKSSKSVYTLESALLPAISLNPVRVVSLTEKMTDGVVIFLAVADADGYLTAQDEKADLMVGFLESFAQQAFRDEKARDVALAEKQLAQAERHHAQLRNEQTRLTDKQARNTDQHHQLEQSLAALENETPTLAATVAAQLDAYQDLVADTVLPKKETARLRQPLSAAEKAQQQHQQQMARTTQKLRANQQQHQRLTTSLAENARRQLAAQEAIAAARQHLEAARTSLAEMVK